MSSLHLHRGPLTPGLIVTLAHALDSAQGAASNCSSLTEFEVCLQSYEEETETKLAVLQSDKV